STAAAGVVGVTVGPALIDGQHTEAINLPQGGVVLQLAPSVPSLLNSPPAQVVAPDVATLNYPGAAAPSPWTGGPGRRIDVGSGGAGPVAPPAPPKAPAREDPPASEPATSSSSTQARIDSPGDEQGNDDQQGNGPKFSTKSNNGNHGSKNRSWHSDNKPKANDRARERASGNSAQFGRSTTTTTTTSEAPPDETTTTTPPDSSG
ncbi:MAG TPA: hypothetical protein VHC18_13730, partial [Amycolatopsis sp.]|nr:hypothetical protein [Amycolatopsis sp.]